VPNGYTPYSITYMGGSYGSSEYGTIISPETSTSLLGSMFAFSPVPGNPSEFTRREVGWFKWNVYEDFEYTSVVKMGVKEGWWLDQVKFASLDSYPSKETRAKFCAAKVGDKFPHVYDVDTTSYDPYGMSYTHYFKRTCLASFVKNSYGEYGDYCQATQDKWGEKNCPREEHPIRRLASEEDPVQMLGDDNNAVVRASQDAEEDHHLSSRQLYDRMCYRYNKLMIRGRFCTFHHTYHGYDKY
jgi:hypothetical protein